MAAWLKDVWGHIVPEPWSNLRNKLTFFLWRPWNLALHLDLACFDCALSVHNTEQGSCVPLLCENVFSLHKKEDFGELITYLPLNGHSECVTATSMTSMHVY